MIEDLLPYYERELELLGQLFAEYAAQNPRAAERLGFSNGQSEDVHVQRMMQSVALTAANISKQLEDEVPQFTEALLEHLHPHYLRPFPSCSIAQMTSTGEPLSAPATIKRGTELNIPGSEIRFRTAYDVTVAPIRIADAGYKPATLAPSTAKLSSDATGIVSIAFEGTLAEFALASVVPTTVRVHVSGAPATTAALIDTLALRIRQAFVEADESGQWVALGQVPLAVVGFDDQDALLPAAKQSSFMQPWLEYFGFPAKFDFIDVGLARVIRAVQRQAPRRVTLHLVVSGLHPESSRALALAKLTQADLKLFCTPVVNLFEHVKVPAKCEGRRTQFPVVPNSAQAATRDVYRINAVWDAATDKEIPPYDALQHHLAKVGATPRYWRVQRDAYVAQKQPGLETTLSVVSEDGRDIADPPQQLDLDVTCTNRDLPAGMRIGNAAGDLHNDAGPVPCRITLLRQPTSTFRLPREGQAMWRAIQMSTPGAEHLSSEGWAAAIRLFRQCLPPWAAQARHVDSVSLVRWTRVRKMVPGKPNPAFVAGLEITLSLDEQAFATTAVSTLVGIIDRYFARYAPANSFTQVVVLSKNNGAEIQRCPLRLGRTQVL